MAKKDAKKVAPSTGKPPVPRLKEAYQTQILPQLVKQLGRSNPHDLPRVQKVVVNMGVGSATVEKKHMEEAVAAMTQITGLSCRARRTSGSASL